MFVSIYKEKTLSMYGSFASVLFHRSGVLSCYPFFILLIQFCYVDEFI